MTSTIIPQRRATVALPAQLRRGRHALNRDRLVPNRFEMLDQRVARWFADRMRPEHLDVVRARAARWSAIAVPVAMYISVALAVVGR